MTRASRQRLEISRLRELRRHRKLPRCEFPTCRQFVSKTAVACCRLCRLLVCENHANPKAHQHSPRATS